MMFMKWRQAADRMLVVSGGVLLLPLDALCFVVRALTAAVGRAGNNHSNVTAGCTSRHLGLHGVEELNEVTHFPHSFNRVSEDRPFMNWRVSKTSFASFVIAGSASSGAPLNKKWKAKYPHRDPMFWCQMHEHTAHERQVGTSIDVNGTLSEQWVKQPSCHKNRSLGSVTSVKEVVDGFGREAHQPK